MPDKRDSIQAAIKAFSNAPFGKRAIELLACLGYQSERRINLGSSSPDAFLEFVRANAQPGIFNESKALCDQWQSADLLFQLTDQELSKQQALFDDKVVSPSLLRSYLFFAIELSGENYARGKLTDIARQINRVFPMPVMVILKHRAQKQPVISIAVINRRQNKIDAAKDVLGKVTIIRDISIDQPHRGHLDILNSIALENLEHPQRLPINNFDNLHTAWEEIFNVELLNKRFYRELANWYFWALPQVEFPDDAEKDAEKRRATSLIRLLTRLIFCWFLKEKGLIPEKLFNETDLLEILKELKPDSCSYHQAILQNLFFGTLNQQMGNNPKTKKPWRHFAKDEGFQKNKSTYGVDNLFRYEDQFRDANSAIDHFADIPFLNGGLFECLDRVEPKTKKKIYIDGFSRNKKKRPSVPNELFFSDEQSGIDLSDAYGERSRRNEKVRGLIRILNSYKFTIVENTPIDQEIALDPELLGKVFENLLASYNEETKTTARKQTGSFYTPRPIVEYMVDESLKAHLSTALLTTGISEDKAKSGLQNLFAYTEEPHPFTNKQVDALLDAIHTCKILDPACGSGAFPMGMLQKLVYIIHKLDSDNAKWMQLQIDKASAIPDSSSRDAAIKAIEQDFADNEDDYGRKLYLIENCLYGVDIQPIAIQISKLRFFISLVCDQKTNRRKKDNHGIRPLPNLETKFVAADTLIALKKDSQLELFESATVKKLESELQQVRHDHFAATTRQKKLSLQDRDRAIRDELAKELKQEAFWDQRTARKLADWDPYDPQASAEYFEPLWMFDRSLADGFDLVIGNPPYVKERDSKKTFARVKDSDWGKTYHVGKMDYWYFFLHRSFDIVKRNGIVALITSRYWVNSTGAKKLIADVNKRSFLFHVVDIGPLPVFEAVAGHHMLHFHQKEATQKECEVWRLNESLEALQGQETKSNVNKQWITSEKLFSNANEIQLNPSSIEIQTGKTLGDLFEVSQGVVQNPDKVSRVMANRYDLPQNSGVFVLEQPELELLNLEEHERSYVKPFYDEASINPFYLDRSRTKRLLYLTKRNCESLAKLPQIKRHLSKYRQIMDARRETRAGSIEWFQLHWPRDEVFFESPKIAMPSMFKTTVAALVDEPAYFGIGSNVIISVNTKLSLKILALILNSSVAQWWFSVNGKQRGIGYDIGVSKLRQLPVCDVGTTGTLEEVYEVFRHAFGPAQLPTSLLAFCKDLIDACVMECYFRDHMTERDLLFLDELAPHLAKYDASASQAKQTEFVEHLYRTLNAPESPIRNRLLRLTASSPDLLAVIKNEGSV